MILATSLFAGKEPDALANDNDFKEDIDAIKAFAEKGVVEAQAVLSLYYLVGLYGVSHDFNESSKWAKKAAEQGDAGSQIRLATFYARGDGVRKSKSKSFKWSKKAAEQEHPEGQYMTAFNYMMGEGVRKNKKEGIKYLKLAAAQENKEAQGVLATEYDNGENIGKNSIKAFELWKAASMQGYQNAMVWLASSYYDGSGVPENYVESYKWFIIAIAKIETEKEFNQLQSLKSLLSKRMGPDQIAQAQKLAAEFKPSQERYLKRLEPFTPEIDAKRLLKKIRDAEKSKADKKSKS